MNAGIVYAICMGFCGIVTALVPVFNSYFALCVISGAFGMFIAANYSLTCIILVELITLERFTNAYGLLLLVQGVANLVGPPLAGKLFDNHDVHCFYFVVFLGWLCDVTGNYELSFYLGGFFIAFSGLLLLVLPATKRYRKFERLQRQVSTDSSVKGPFRFHLVLASCITGQIREEKETDANHV